MYDITLQYYSYKTSFINLLITEHIVIYTNWNCYTKFEQDPSLKVHPPVNLQYISSKPSESYVPCKGEKYRRLKLDWNHRLITKESKIISSKYQWVK